MADDTRQSNASPPEDLSQAALTVHPEHKPFAGSQWKADAAQTVKAPESANIMPGGTQHTAGGKEPEFNLVNVMKTGRPITEVHKAPCVRSSLMQAMGAGVVVGATRALFGTPVFKACSWAVGTWAGTSIFLYHSCQYKRQAEKQGMIRAMDILDQKRMEKQVREERKAALREERRIAKEKELEEQYQAASDKQGGGKAWYRFW